LRAGPAPLTLVSSGGIEILIHFIQLEVRVTTIIARGLALVAHGLLMSSLPSIASAQTRNLDSLLNEVTAEIEANQRLTQVIVDKLFSFGELGFQEVETTRYLVGLLRENGFQVEQGGFGIPTAWVARWGSGEPVISFGSDVDGIPRASQRPGVAYHAPLVEGAPGHGEGHNSGQAVNVTAALALKKVMQRERIQGTIVLWPGVAEELVGAKPWFVRDGLFQDVDAVLFTHVGTNLGVSWGQANGTGLVSVEFNFTGEAAHAAGAPWRGRSALDAAMLMEIGWNFRREHLRPEQRSHSVISDGGDQPNVVPSAASIWYYVREMDYPDIRRNLDIAIRIAEGAAMMTDTRMEYRILGAAWPRHFNRPIAETMYQHIVAVGLPQWSEADQILARAVQKEVASANTSGLSMTVDSLRGPPRVRLSGASDDIGDVSWVVPTVTLTFPSNIPGLPGHHWSNAISMATPIAHKGATAGAKVLARTALEMFLKPAVLEDAWKYFREVQTKDTQYTPLIGAADPPAIWMNAETMEEFRVRLQPYYYDETRYRSYLEQLGITYPTVRPQQ
jgi:aminobenzoyl-glutamate utilization protein B